MSARAADIKISSMLKILDTGHSRLFTSHLHDNRGARIYRRGNETAIAAGATEHPECYELRSSAAAAAKNMTAAPG